ncbi:MAG TPA: peptidylprolyl isomerase [Candidatus Limnocylindrales bacterium]|nr:peptidylprolyl isomerase [Candidatus Limnocylindrales bacterium]
MGKKGTRDKKNAANRRSKWPSTPLIVTGIVVIVGAVALLINAGRANKTGGEQYMGITKPVVTIEMEGGGVIKVELDPVNAPNTVRNFIALAEQGFYNGLIFHRVIPGFMIQGGCPQGTGTAGPGYNIRGEFTANRHDNNLLHSRGVISMARSQGMNTAGSQFFITVATVPHLDGQYAAFGTVIEGMEIVDRIVQADRDRSDKPLEPQTIKTITVDTFGITFEPPDKN